MTPREKIHLRLLREGNPQKDEYEEVRYLKDKGLADAGYRVSKGRDTYGEILDVYWRGPTAEGMDYLEQLEAKAQAEHDGQEQAGQPKPSTQAAMAESTPSSEKLWHERSSWRTAIFLILIGVIVSFLSQCAGLGH